MRELAWRSVNKWRCRSQRQATGHFLSPLGGRATTKETSGRSLVLAYARALP